MWEGLVSAGRKGGVGAVAQVAEPENLSVLLTDLVSGSHVI